MLKNEQVLKQIVNHFYKQYDLALIYSIYSNTINAAGMENLSNYVMELSNDKVGPHAERLMNFFNLSGVELTNYSKTDFKVKKEPKTIDEIVDTIHTIEYEIREEINNIAKDCIANGYLEALEFLNWFLKDGLKDFSEIDCIKIIFDQNKNLSYIQKDVLIKSYIAK